MTVPLPAASGAYTGPKTGDVLDTRQLAELEGLRAARAVTAPFPAVVGDWFTPFRRAARAG